MNAPIHGFLNLNLETMSTAPALKSLVKGFMLESYLKTGQQNIETCTSAHIDLNGLSITDPCLGFEQTKALLFELASEVSSI